jgi:hypothetical protein
MEPPFLHREFEIYLETTPEVVKERMLSIVQFHGPMWFWGNKPFAGRLEGDLFTLQQIGWLTLSRAPLTITVRIISYTPGCKVRVNMVLRHQVHRVFMWVMYAQLAFGLVVMEAAFALGRVSFLGFLLAIGVIVAFFLICNLDFHLKAFLAERVLRKTIRSCVSCPVVQSDV